MFRPPSTHADSTAATCSVMVPISTRSAAWKGSLANLRMVRIEPSKRQRRDDGVDARAVGQTGVHHGGGLVDAPADLDDDAVDDPPQVLVGDEPGAGLLDHAARST